MRTFEHQVQTQGGPKVTVTLGNPTVASLAEFFSVPAEQVQIIEDDDGEEYVIVAGRGEGVIGCRT